MLIAKANARQWPPYQSLHGKDETGRTGQDTHKDKLSKQKSGKLIGVGG